MSRAAIVPALFASVLSCASPRQPIRVPPPPEPEVAIGDEIVVCGERVAIGAPVVLWTDPGGYDATSTTARFGTKRSSGPEDGEPRYTPGRAERGEGGAILLEPDSRDLEGLRAIVDILVLHYDACGTSRSCFEILHDVRGLSAHFLLDLDGTLYQTMDLRDQAWHAREANPRSIGVEIANIGAYPPGESATLDEWYRRDAEGTRIVLPASAGPSGFRRPDFVPRPARDEPVVGSIDGELLQMYDLTSEQYDSLVRLTAVLCRTLPRIAPDAPRDRTGRVLTAPLSPADLALFRGILGHYHVTGDKADPGPAFDWQGFLARVRARLSATPGS